MPPESARCGSAGSRSLRKEDARRMVFVAAGARRDAGAHARAGRRRLVPDARRGRLARSLARRGNCALRSRVAALRRGRSRCSTPSPPARPGSEAHARRGAESAVELATARIRDDDSKIVLAREVVVEAAVCTTPRRSTERCASSSRPASASASARGRRRSSARAPAAGAPERRCGSNCRARGLDAPQRRSAVDDHLGEQLVRSAKDRNEHEIVARRIERTRCGRTRCGSRPSASRAGQGGEHPAPRDPIHAQLAEPRSALKLAGAASPHAGGGGRAAGCGDRGDRGARGG